MFAASAVVQATNHVTRLLQMSPTGITVSHIRKSLGTSRKFVVPLLAHLDAIGLTARRDDLRIEGRRMLAHDPANGGGS
ncbi:MAG: SelB C-terminal domain-containing protein [Actinobacteria bacterium]|nr:SelB C-terminal domain-containing protein [Actinomycetota bacterium]